MTFQIVGSVKVNIIVTFIKGPIQPVQNEDKFFLLIPNTSENQS